MRTKHVVSNTNIFEKSIIEFIRTGGDFQAKCYAAHDKLAASNSISEEPISVTVKEMRDFGLLSWRDNRVLAGGQRQLLVVPNDNARCLEVVEFVESKVTLLYDAHVLL